MKIKTVSMLLAGAACLAGVSMCASCSEDKYSQKAKEQAIKYLDGNQLLKAERVVYQQPNNDTDNGDAIAYWDSLLIEAKAHEAYVKGQQYIIDSINGKHYRKEKYNAPLDTIIPRRSDVIDDSKNEYAKYLSAEDYIKARDNAPSSYKTTFFNNLVGSTHYWNLITMAYKQKEAYQKGMAYERAKLNEAKGIKPIDPLVKAAIDAYNSTVTRDVIDKSAIIEVYKNIK